MNDVKDIRITDPYVKSIIAKVKQIRHGEDGTVTKTANQMILERWAQIEAQSPTDRRPRRAKAG